MTGDLGPYVEMAGPHIWVPRTVPYLEARHIARSAIQEYDNRLTYLGKTDATLFGFARDCFCEETCRLTDTEADDFDGSLEDACVVPAWHFREDEPR